MANAPGYNSPDALARYLANQTSTTPKPTFDIAGLGGQLSGVQIGGQTTTIPYVAESTPTTSTTSGGSGGGGASNTNTQSGPDASTLANDWYKAFFAQYGVPADVQAQLISLLTKYASDPSIAQTLATQYLRSTPWYQTTFPGFSEGVNNGVFTDETGYRAYLNAINSIYNQYLGRHVSGDEVTALLKEGAAPSLVANRFQGQAWVQANSPEVQYLGGAFGNGRLTPDQLTALGNENAGIDTAQGQIQQKMLQKAQQVLQKIQTGTLATPSLSLGNNGLSAPGLAGTKQAPDVAA